MTGAKLRAARLAAGLAQADLARLIGVDSTQISRWERDKVAPGADALKKLRAALQVSAEPDVRERLARIEAKLDLLLAREP